MRRAILAATVAALPLAAGNYACADERLVPLASGGEWVAVAHTENMTARPDVCGMANMAKGVVFRSDADGLEFRVTNSTWSLPPDVDGAVTIAVGAWTTSLDIGSNTDTMVAAAIGSEIEPAMFAAMDKAATMTVTVGKAKPFQVSLNGSTRVSNAFRTCAGINSNTKTPGSNPFE